MTQTITLKETNEVYRVQDMVYPLSELGSIYIRLVVVDDYDNPTDFLIVQPNDVLYRKMSYDQELMDQIESASEDMRQEYIKHMEKIDEIPTEDIVSEHDRFYG